MECSRHHSLIDFGGKSRVAGEVWQRFGQVQNYVEPFFGSGAVLLGCSHPGHTETVNDADGLLANFWRALQHDPDGVAHHADWPVSELDLHARHRWLVKQRADMERLLEDPAYYDVQIAGWWVWGISQWIGSGWCESKQTSEHNKRPHLISNKGVNRNHGQLPHVGDAGRGVHRAHYGKIPSIGATGPAEKTTGKGSGEKGVFKQDNLVVYLHALAVRLRRVRVTCGDFERVLGPSVTWRHGMTAVFLDPPYDRTERAAVYAVETDVAERARQWAIANGDNPLLRIALCGYDSITMPDGWHCHKWKAAGGYGGQGTGRGRENAAREVIWFSPHCLNDTPLERWAREQEDMQ